MNGGPLLVIGATGILGRAVALEASRRGVDPVVVTYRSRPGAIPAFGDTARHLDVADREGVFELLAAVRPSVVVNCAGLTKALSTDANQAHRANTLGPRTLRAACDELGSRLVHVSTDCVFDGAGGPYSEQDRPNATDVYGRSKAAGEIDVPPHLTVRTSFIGEEYGTRYGLLAWLLCQKGEVPGFTNHLWSGLTATQLARALLELAAAATVTGLLHVSGQGLSKYELLALLARRLALDVEVRPVEAPCGVDRRLVTVRSAVAPDVPPIEEMVEELATSVRQQID